MECIRINVCALKDMPAAPFEGWDPTGNEQRALSSTASIHFWQGIMATQRM